MIENIIKLNTEMTFHNQTYNHRMPVMLVETNIKQHLLQYKRSSEP